MPTLSRILIEIGINLMFSYSLFTGTGKSSTFWFDVGLLCMIFFMIAYLISTFKIANILNKGKLTLWISLVLDFIIVGIVINFKFSYLGDLIDWLFTSISELGWRSMVILLAVLMLPAISYQSVCRIF